MPASPKPKTKLPVQPPARSPWCGWIDVAVGIGNVVVAYELMLAAAWAPMPAAHRASPVRTRLALVYSRAAAAAPLRPRPRLSLQQVGPRDEGKA